MSKHEVAPIIYTTPEATFKAWLNPGAISLLSTLIVVEGTLSEREVDLRGIPTSMGATQFTIQRRVYHLGGRERLTRNLDEVLNEVAEWMDVEPVIDLG